MTARSRAIDDRIARTISRMEEMLSRTPRVPDLAASVQLSPSRFAHLFRAEIGVPPARYLHTMRMERARLLLERTSLSVREVMLCVGFRDPSHFARDFRHFHGVAPREVRESATRPGPAPDALLEHLLATDRRSVTDDVGRPEPSLDRRRSTRRRS
jgi:AraC family transcriptional regulator, arabinose operon regulatory protein